VRSLQPAPGGLCRKLGMTAANELVVNDEVGHGRLVVPQGGVLAWVWGELVCLAEVVLR
jgi:hypothetical protein